MSETRQPGDCEYFERNYTGPIKDKKIVDGGRRGYFTVDSEEFTGPVCTTKAIPSAIIQGHLEDACTGGSMH